MITKILFSTVSTLKIPIYVFKFDINRTLRIEKIFQLFCVPNLGSHYSVLLQRMSSGAKSGGKRTALSEYILFSKERPWDFKRVVPYGLPPARKINPHPVGNERQRDVTVANSPSFLRLACNLHPSYSFFRL